MGEAHTPGPLTIREDDGWPFHIEIIAPDGRPILTQGRAAFSSLQRTLADCRAGVGFQRGEEAEAARQAIREQDANIRLWAAAPSLLAACRDALEQYVALARDPATNPWVKQLRAAIALAEGRPEAQAEER